MAIPRNTIISTTDTLWQDGFAQLHWLHLHRWEGPKDFRGPASNRPVWLLQYVVTLNFASSFQSLY